MNNTSIIFTCENDVTLGSCTLCLQLLREVVNQYWRSYLQLIVL